MTNTNIDLARYNMTATIQAGTKVLTDSRVEKGYLWDEQRLEVCDYWDAADYILPGRGIIPDQAVKVAVTGRKVRYDAPGLGGLGVIRVRVTFVGDCEPDVTVGGWILASEVL